MARSKTPIKTVRTKMLKVEVSKNKMTKHVSEVPQWEAHVLMALWGDDARVIDEPYYIDRRAPASAEDEFQRLADKYGPKDADTPLIAQVYGSFGPGLRSLSREIDISTEPVEDEDEPVAAEPVVVEPVVVEPVVAEPVVAEPDIEGEGLTEAEVDALANAAPTVSVTTEDGEVVEANPDDAAAGLV